MSGNQSKPAQSDPPKLPRVSKLVLNAEYSLPKAQGIGVDGEVSYLADDSGNAMVPSWDMVADVRNGVIRCCKKGGNPPYFDVPLSACVFIKYCDPSPHALAMQAEYALKKTG